LLGDFGSGREVWREGLGCHREKAAARIGRHADYVLALKGNHATVHLEVKEFLDQAVSSCAIPCANIGAAPEMDFHQTIEKALGRIETRRYWKSTGIHCSRSWA
jgi:hypothetical protein